MYRRLPKIDLINGAFSTGEKRARNILEEGRGWKRWRAVKWALIMTNRWDRAYAAVWTPTCISGHALRDIRPICYRRRAAKSSPKRKWMYEIDVHAPIIVLLRHRYVLVIESTRSERWTNQRTPRTRSKIMQARRSGLSSPLPLGKSIVLVGDHDRRTVTSNCNWIAL